MKRLALNIIVKNEVEELDRCLDSVYQYVDSIYILITGDNPKTDEVCKKYKATYIREKNVGYYAITKRDVREMRKIFGWKPESKAGDDIFMFDKARNRALEMVPKDYKYLLWLDADDIVRGAENIHQVIDNMDEKKATAVFMTYFYEVELNEKQEIKNVLVKHERERIILNDGRYHWVAPIHETLISKTGEVMQIVTDKADVVHLAHMKKRTEALWRNIKVLEKSIVDTKGKDPRPIYYLAKAYYDLHTADSYTKAEKLIYRYLKSSGWAEERAQAYEYLTEIFRARKEHSKAIKASLNAMIEDPKFPSVYLNLALSMTLVGRWDDAMQFINLATKTKTPQTTLVLNPRDSIVRALEVVYNCSLKQAKLDDAWAAIAKLKEYFPNDVGIKAQYDMIRQMLEQRDLSLDFVTLAKKLIANNEPDKLRALTFAVPKQIEGNPIIEPFVTKYKPARVWPKKSVVIYCGPGWTAWNSELFKKKREDVFIGGSEEAVIYLSQELVKQGYKVTIYGDPGEEGTYNGVEYLNHFKINLKDDFDIFIVWRHPEFFDHKVNAKKTYLWLHDVPNPMDFKKERLDNLTKIIVLSQAHRILLPNIPDNKFFLTSNGFVEEYPEIKPVNNPNTCIWTSSYDRGLQHLLEIWPDVKKAVPNANLRIFYGWKLWSKMYATNPERMAWKQKIEEMMKYEGIYHGSRLTQGELEKEIKKASIWSYPTDFYEINCISAIKAQAFGAVPVVMDYGALKETVQFGIKVEGDIWDKETKKLYKERLIAQLSAENKYKQKMMEWAKESYSWPTVVKSWIKEFLL